MNITRLLLATIPSSLFLFGCATDPGSVGGGTTDAKKMVADYWIDKGAVAPSVAPGLYFTVAHTDKWHVSGVWDFNPLTQSTGNGQELFFYNYSTNKVHPLLDYNVDNPWDTFLCPKNKKPRVGEACASQLAEVNVLAKIAMSGQIPSGLEPYKFTRARIAAVIDDIGIDDLKRMAHAGRLRRYDLDYQKAQQDSLSAREFVADYSDMDFEHRIPIVKANILPLERRESKEVEARLKETLRENREYLRERYQSRGASNSSSPEASPSPRNGTPTCHYESSDGNYQNSQINFDGTGNGWGQNTLVCQ